jgi:REP element-mobilizing transposase RayT
MATLKYDSRKKVYFLVKDVTESGKTTKKPVEVPVESNSVHALLVVGNSMDKATIQAYQLYTSLSEEDRRDYKAILEDMFSRMTVNVWSWCIDDANMRYVYENMGQLAVQAYHTLPQEKWAEFLPIAKHECEVNMRGASARFIRAVNKEKAAVKKSTPAPARTIEVIMAELAAAEKVVEALRKELETAKAK